ncbi:DNA polymerase III subunit chi [Kaistia dalseonensis]|uniref:DNA polymerase-3 subunit chi n=1 Tax=Kaistia dalseonensis TaxID=410840 RepID=A0ABU0H0C8_9HYPH|nr:DNA polymerase III subunit chi [Kaistia dalseonensis]MCX5493215.1 DNA polymerase III subunit chi [Kaistia dalseonensis]MDQ0435770.1 DNA polymerase-3 subunit chi [Kaistia dalseonensis]
MTDVLFYHLQRQPLEAVLPPLLEKCLERRWRVVVATGSVERCDALDALLWTYRSESFLPHGTWRDAAAALHPVVLAAQTVNPNRANVRFAVDGAPLGPVGDFERVVVLFDGNDPDALDQARSAWREVKTAGHAATYWQQSEHGRWEKKA